MCLKDEAVGVDQIELSQPLVQPRHSTMCIVTFGPFLCDLEDPNMSL